MTGIHAQRQPSTFNAHHLERVSFCASDKHRIPLTHLTRSCRIHQPRTIDAKNIWRSIIWRNSAQDHLIFIKSSKLSLSSMYPIYFAPFVMHHARIALLDSCLVSLHHFLFVVENDDELYEQMYSRTESVQSIQWQKKMNTHFESSFDSMVFPHKCRFNFPHVAYKQHCYHSFLAAYCCRTLDENRENTGLFCQRLTFMFHYFVCTFRRLMSSIIWAFLSFCCLHLTHIFPSCIYAPVVCFSLRFVFIFFFLHLFSLDFISISGASMLLKAIAFVQHIISFSEIFVSFSQHLLC